MFKARTKKKQAFKRKQIDNDSSDDDNKGDHVDNDQHSTSGALDILAKKKKERSLLRNLKFKKRKNDEKQTSLMSQRQNSVTEFSGESSSTLERKHEEAMNNYINSKLKDKDVRRDSLEREVLSENKSINQHGVTELFHSIAKQAITTGTDAAGKETFLLKSKEADVGSGGNILGGTGIAEVSLSKSMPAPSSGKIFRQSKHDEAQMIIKAGLPSAFGCKPKRQMFSTKPDQNQKMKLENQFGSSVDFPSNKSMINTSDNSIPTSFSHNYRKHNRDWAIKRRADEEKATEEARIELEHNDSSGRIGFEAARGEGKFVNIFQ